jgi:FkbM family methyltransferase
MYLNLNGQSISLDKGFFEMYPNTRYEFNLIEWCMENYADPNKVFIDVGAHIGTYTWSLAPYFKHTYSFECNPTVFPTLLINCLCKSTTITTYNSAVSDEVSTNTPYIIRSSDGGGNGIIYKGDIDSDLNTIEVDTVTLDTYFKSRDDVGLIKIDAEGAELKVIKGALETLESSNYPPILFESWDPSTGKFEDDLRKELFDFISSIGYDITPLNNTTDMFIATV